MTPGIHTMAGEQYHAADGVSRSMLEWLTPPKTPAHFKAKWIDGLIPDDDTPALRTGSLVHRCILEPDTLGDAFHVEPSEIQIERKRLAKLKSAKVLRGVESDSESVIVAWSGKFTECEDWTAAHSDKPIISAGEAKRIEAMRDSVWSHPLASRILKHSDHERSAFAEDNGLLLKSRFDALPRTGNMIADLKTCDSADLASVEKAVSKWGYYRQAAFYLRVANLLGLKREVFAFIFVEKSPPYAVAVYQLDDVVVEAGALTIKRDLALLRRCRESNQWPGYSTELETCGLPKWEMDRINNEIAA